MGFLKVPPTLFPRTGSLNVQLQGAPLRRWAGSWMPSLQGTQSPGCPRLSTHIQLGHMWPFSEQDPGFRAVTATSSSVTGNTCVWLNVRWGSL